MPSRLLNYKLQITNYQITNWFSPFLTIINHGADFGSEFFLHTLHNRILFGSAAVPPLNFSFDDAARGAGGPCGAHPGSTSILIGLPARPLAAAVAMRRASLVNDISIIVPDAAIFAISAFPFRLHSAFSNRETSIC